MDYEKKYKEALGWMKSVYPTMTEAVKDDAEHYFPELKESEDEKTMQKFIKLVKMSSEVGGFALHKWEADEMLAWLEKQDRLMKALQISNARIGELIDNKVEPKFNAGDWITFTRKDGTREVLQVSDIIDDRYYFNHLLQFSWSIKECNEKCHLWTIEDAKDGDVLCYKDEISLYKHDIKNCTKQETIFGGFAYHCCYDGKRFITDGLYSLTEKDKTDIHPATKEQRDTLEKAMADAGYTFDFEKKELKKIEQNNTDEYIETKGLSEIEAEAEELAKKQFDEHEQKLVWSEEDDIRLNSTISFLKRYKGIDYENTGVCISWLKFLKDRCLPQPKQEWSEEDERNASYICVALDCYYRLREDRNNTNGQEDLDKARNWLYNKLKYIMPQNHWKPIDTLPQQRQEWSKKDEGYYNSIIEHLKYSITNGKPETYISGSLTDWLKSLKDRVQPQSKQEWSKEDKEMFAIISDLLWEGYKVSGGKPTWEEIRDWFRANYPQNHWKPSKEQMERLKGTINSLPHQEVLYSLYQDLKKLREE